MRPIFLSSDIDRYQITMFEVTGNPQKPDADFDLTVDVIDEVYVPVKLSSVWQFAAGEVSEIYMRPI